MVFSLAVALTVAQGSTKVVNDDRDVIQASLLTFFKHEEWYAADWKPKKMLLLRTNYRGKNRPDFKVEVASMSASHDSQIGYYARAIAEGRSRKRHVGELRRLREELKFLQGVDAQASGKFVPPKLIPLKSMGWDKRIVVTDDGNRPLSSAKPNPALEKWTVSAQVSLPSYSPDGRYAILNMHIPWSMHSADVAFLMERTESGWIRRAATAKFYV